MTSKRLARISAPSLARRMTFVAAFATLPFGEADALTWQNPFDPQTALESLVPSSKNVTLHPFGPGVSALVMPHALELFKTGQLGLEDAVRRTMAERLNPLIEMRFEDSTDGMALAAGTTSRDVKFYVSGYELVGYQLRAHALSDKTLMLLGTVPSVDPSVRFSPDDWASLDLAAEKARQDVGAIEGRSGDAKVVGGGRVLFVENGELMPVWNMTVMKGDLPYDVLADGYKVYKTSPRFLDATTTGSASVYPRSGLDKTKEKVELPNLVGDGTLSSNYLQTVLPASGYTQAKEPSGNFSYADDDARFIELSSYAHAQLHHAFYQKMGFTWYGPSPIQIHIHMKPGGQSNNALFVPGNDSTGTLPQIQIDDGDGVDLQNLGLDGDVVSHEYGHHIIYRTLRTTAGQSLAMHEGLADFFAFSRTGDPCLGESICPETSGACIIAGKCLRSAAIDLKYGDTNWTDWAGPKNQLGHLHGQLISGVLWDLRASGDMAGDDVTKLALKAVSFFKTDSGFRDFLLTLFMADKELFAGANFEKIKARASERGMDPFLADITAEDSLPSLIGGGSDPTTTTVNVLPAGSSGSSSGSTKSSKGSDNPFSCGAIPGAGGDLQAIGLILILGLPLLASLVPTPARARARGKRPRPETKRKT